MLAGRGLKGEKGGRGVQEDKGSLTNFLRNFNVGAVHGPKDEAAVHLELHVGGARALCAGCADVVGHLCCRDDDLCQRDIVVWEEDDLDSRTLH